MVIFQTAEEGGALEDNQFGDYFIRTESDMPDKDVVQNYEGDYRVIKGKKQQIGKFSRFGFSWEEEPTRTIFVVERKLKTSDEFDAPGLPLDRVFTSTYVYNRKTNIISAPIDAQSTGLVREKFLRNGGITFIKISALALNLAQATFIVLATLM